VNFRSVTIAIGARSLENVLELERPPAGAVLIL
jgi:hypothetical protein